MFTEAYHISLEFYANLSFKRNLIKSFTLACKHIHLNRMKSHTKAPKRPRRILSQWLFITNTFELTVMLLLKWFCKMVS